MVKKVHDDLILGDILNIEIKVVVFDIGNLWEVNCIRVENDHLQKIL